MNESSDHLLRRPARESWFSRFQIFGLVVLTLLAIIVKVYLPRIIPSTAWLELPLLLTVYFGLVHPNQIAALLFGAFVGLAEDSLAPAIVHPIGMFGITKTLVGYFAASVSMRFNVENALIRLVLCFFFYVFHAFMYWLMRRALLGQLVPFDPQETLIYGVLNAAVALPLFLILDKMKMSGSRSVMI
jgi:rod shape-determining protein MreD